jgi:hypothetical protein
VHFARFLASLFSDHRVQYPDSVNALLIQAMLCVSHNGTIADPILTGFGGCFEMLKNFGFNISGSAFVFAA